MRAWLQAQPSYPWLIPAEVVGELVTQGPLDLLGKQGAIVSEVALERVAIDDDPVLEALVRNPVSEVLAVCMHLGSEIGDHDRHFCQHLLKFIRQAIDRVSDQRFELIELIQIGHCQTVAGLSYAQHSRFQ
jgi:hypothetical protein